VAVHRPSPQTTKQSAGHVCCSPAEHWPSPHTMRPQSMAQLWAVSPAPQIASPQKPQSIEQVFAFSNALLQYMSPQ
jgi:hypothetical protein